MMDNLTQQLADALRECAEYLAAHLEEGSDHRVIVAADSALAAYDSAQATPSAPAGTSGAHSVEPWVCAPTQSDHGNTLTVQQAGGWTIARTYGHTSNDRANARRIVACVNACAGIPTEQLEVVQLAAHLPASWSR